MKSNQVNLLGALGLLTMLSGCYSSNAATVKDDCPPGQDKALDGSGICVDLLSEIADRPRHPKKPATVSPASPSAAPATTVPAVTTPQCPPGQIRLPKGGCFNDDINDYVKQ